MITRAVITAGGVATRLQPWTKELPKELAPVFRLYNSNVIVQPLIQTCYEQLFLAGIREFNFVGGRRKRSLEDHFTQDYDFLEFIKGKGRHLEAEVLQNFYKMLDESTIRWINQPKPMGFGDAVKRGAFEESFIVHAGDTYLNSTKRNPVKELIRVHEKYNADAVIVIGKEENPRKYGVVECELVEGSVYHIKDLAEKPEEPKTNLAIRAVYSFNPLIVGALDNVKINNGELQLTDGIKELVRWRDKVYGMLLDEDEGHIDIGTPESFSQAMEKRLVVI